MSIENIDAMQMEADLDMLSELYWQTTGISSEEQVEALSRIYYFCENAMKSCNVVDNAPALIGEADLTVGDPCRTDGVRNE